MDVRVGRRRLLDVGLGRRARCMCCTLSYNAFMKVRREGQEGTRISGG